MFSDIPTILELIKELAAYENQSSAVAATKSSLASTLTFAESESKGKSEGAANSDSTTPTQPNGTTSQGNTQRPTFTQGGYARALMAFTPSSTVPQKPVGMALHFNNYSTWRSAPGIYLEDLFVRPEFRGRGYGRALVTALAAEVVAIDGARLEWSCLKWNEPSLKFYASLGAKKMSDWVALRVEGEALEKLGNEGKGLVQLNARGSMLKE